MPRTPAVGALVVLGLALVATTVAGARTSAFGIPQTRACLTKKGASFNPTTPGVVHPGLTAAQQAEVMTGTLPVGGAPLFFTLVVGTNATDAAKVLHVLRNDVSPGARWTSAKDNAAWTLVSITGAVTTAARTMFVACLTQGKPPSGVAPSPAHYVLATVATCLDALSNGAVMRPAKAVTYVPLVFEGRKLPPAAAPHTVLAYTATNANSRDGLGIFVLFGRTGTNAAQLRTSVQQALGLRGAGITTGAKKNAAWVSFRTRNTTTAGARSGLKALGTCLN